MQFGVGFILSLTTYSLAIPVEFERAMVRDNTGRLHAINQDIYSVIDAEFERSFNADTDVVFRLYTRINLNQSNVLEWNNAVSIENSSFNPAHPTKFTVHGWNGDGTSTVHGILREQYFAISDFNMIAVDWGAGAHTINYLNARNRVGAVGAVISKMVNTLLTSAGVSLESVSIIGHSLGAHAAGNAGKKINQLQGRQIHTIVGLDPAGPLFSWDHDDILQTSDAEYVEAVYTNAGSLGFYLPLGDANFYANGGRFQPGCGIDLVGNCAHSRSYELFAESLTSLKGFRATRCEPYDQFASNGCTPSDVVAMMGGEPSNHGRGVDGIYMFNTNSKSPFALG